MDITKTAIDAPNWNVGSGTVNTSPAQLISTSFPVVKGVTLRADSGNTGKILVGPNSANQAYVLSAGNSIELPLSDVSLIWIVGSASGQNYSWLSV